MGAIGTIGFRSVLVVTQSLILALHLQLNVPNTPTINVPNTPTINVPNNTYN